MIKTALEYIVKNANLNTIERDGKLFSDKELIQINRLQSIKPLELSTLNSFVDYIKDNKDNLDYKNISIIIEDFNTVKLITKLDFENKRENLATCKAKTNVFDFDTFHNKEKFIIALQSQFCNSEDRTKILQILGTIHQESGITNEDNGVSQSIKTKKGIVLGENTIIPNPIELAPFRTFVEIKQPSSQFIFRIKEQQEELRMALFEADGRVWILESIQIIKQYLENKLKEEIEKGLNILA